MAEWVTAAEWVATLRQPDAWLCPRCGEVLEEVEGWYETVDREVAITVLACWACGWEPDEP